MIRIIADTIRKYFRKCLEKNPHFALIADETSSQGRDVLSVLSSTAIQNSLQKHAIDITNCRGQAYDTNASMSSDKKGVQAEIARCAPDAKYQGCCLHSINLVICHACKIKSTQNMMDSFHELFSFFDNSPKRQKFLSIVIDTLSPENKKHRPKDLCKTRWIERHSTSEAIFELYEYIAITLNERCVPTNDDKRFYPNNPMDAKTKIMANGLRHSMRCFGHIVGFIWAKEMLEPIRPLVTAPQGRHVEVFFSFQKIEEVISSYTGRDKQSDLLLVLTYVRESCFVVQLVGSIEGRPRVYSRQRHREN